MEHSRFVPVMRALPAVRRQGGRGAPVLAVLALAACAAPGPPLPPIAAEDVTPRLSEEALAAFVAGPRAGPARAREEQRRGIGVPPALPRRGTVDRLSGTLRASRPAPGTGPAPSVPPPALPVPSNALSRLSALPASPLANPPGGLGLGRPWP